MQGPDETQPIQPLVSEKIISEQMALSFQTFVAGACKGADSKMLNDVQWQWLEVIDITLSKMTRPFFPQVVYWF